MLNYQIPNEIVEISAKKQIGVTLKINIKMFNGKNLPHELLLTTRQKTK